MEEIAHSGQPSLNVFQNSNLKNQYSNIDCQMIYKNFETKPVQSFLGISIQNEKMYVVQKKSISVFQFYPQLCENSQNQANALTGKKVPYLIKQIFLPFEILKYFITEKYICIKSKNKTQIRDNQFQKLIYTQESGIFTFRNIKQFKTILYKQSITYDIFQQLEIQCEIIDDEMVCWKSINRKKSDQSDAKYLREYWSEKINILTKNRSLIKCHSQLVDPCNKSRKLETFKQPLFVDQLGYIGNFYIWPYSSVDLQIGIYYNQKKYQNFSENALYQICSFQLKQSYIKDIFYYQFKGNSQKKNSDGPHIFIAICQNMKNEKSKIKVIVFQVLPHQTINNDESQNESLNNYLDQFNQLKKQKKSQQSISNSNLLNEILAESEEKQKKTSNENKSTSIVQSLILEQSSSYRKSFYNSKSKVLWIDDNSENVYKIKLIQQLDIKKMREKSFSFIEKMEQYRKSSPGSKLQGILNDKYPVFKHDAIQLQIGFINSFVQQKKQGITIQKDGIISKQESGLQKEVIQINDQELQKIQKFREIKKNKESVSDEYSMKEEVKFEQRQKQKIQLKTFIDQQIQTQEDFNEHIKEQQKILEKVIQVPFDSLPGLLKSLNFSRVEDSLIRLSSLFVANVTKNVNKLKEVNLKAKQEIKQKINNDIFDVITQIFQVLMGDTLGEKIQKQVQKAKEFVEKIFNKHIEHFNLMILQEKIKEQNIRKHIIEEQLRSVQVIKDASIKFLDVTKIRQMQKIACNQVVIESIKQVGESIKAIQSKLNLLIEQTQKVQKNISQQIKEIKESFKLLIQLDKDENQGQESDNSESVQCQDSGFQSGEQEQERSNQQNQQYAQYKYKDKMSSFHQGTYVNSPRQNVPLNLMAYDSFNNKGPQWAHSYQEPYNISYGSYNDQINSQRYHPSSVREAPNNNQINYSQMNPYQNMNHSRNQKSYQPYPMNFHPSSSQIKKGQLDERRRQKRNDQKKRKIKRSNE